MFWGVTKKWSYDLKLDELFSQSHILHFLVMLTKSTPIVLKKFVVKLFSFKLIPGISLVYMNFRHILHILCPVLSPHRINILSIFGESLAENWKILVVTYDVPHEHAGFADSWVANKQDFEHVVAGKSTLRSNCCLLSSVLYLPLV